MEPIHSTANPCWLWQPLDIPPYRESSEQNESMFSIVHHPPISTFSLPLYWLRVFLLFNEELLCDGNFNPNKLVGCLESIPIRNELVEQVLDNTFTISYRDTPHKITLRELITHYRKLFPHHDIHWIGSSLPLGKDWSTQYLKNAPLDEQMASFFSKCFDYIGSTFSDIDIRFMVPPGLGDHTNYVVLAIENLCQHKFGDTSFRLRTKPFDPDSKTKTLSFEKQAGDHFDIDLVQCSHMVPLFVTTHEAAYISINDYFTTGKAVPQFLEGVRPGEYFLHQATKIIYVPDRPKINAGTLKRVIQNMTYGSITPQFGIIQNILEIFNEHKGGRNQFFEVFRKRKTHLDPHPKTELAYCLNLISLVEEFYPPEYKANYWEQCAKLLAKPQKGLSTYISRYIKEHHEGCGELVTVLKTCCLTSYATKRISAERSESDSLYPVYPGVQNGEPFLVMPLSQQTAVHLKLDAHKTITDLLEYLDFVAKTPDASRIKKSKLVNILMNFLQKQIAVTLEPNKEHCLYEFACLNIDPSSIQDALTGYNITNDPIIHLLNLIWKSIHHACHPDSDVNVRDILSSLTPGLLILDTKEFQDQLITLISSSIDSPLVLKILQGLKEKPELSFDEILFVILSVLSQEGFSELGFQLWQEAIKHQKYSNEGKCRGLLELVAPTYAKNKDLVNRRICSLLTDKQLNPLLLAGLCHERGLTELALIAFEHCHYSNVKKHPKSLTSLASISGKVPLPLRCKLISFLTHQEQFSLANKHLRKLPYSKLCPKYKSAMKNCATQIINHFIDKGNHDLAIKSFQFYKGHLLSDLNQKKWKFVTQISQKVTSQSDVSEKYINIVKSLLEQATVVPPKLAELIKTTLSTILRHAKFSQKLVILCTLNRSKTLNQFHKYQFKKLVKKANQEQKLEIARSYSQDEEWDWVAQTLVTVPVHNFCKRSSHLGIVALNHLSLRTNPALTWKLFLLCQDYMEDALLMQHLPEVTSPMDQEEKLSCLVNRVYTIDHTVGLQLLYRLIGHEIPLQNLPLILGILQENIDDPLVSWAAYRSVTRSFKTKELLNEKVAFLKTLIAACEISEEHYKLIGDILILWGCLGVDPKDFTCWVNTLTLFLESHLNHAHVEEIVGFLQLLHKQKWFQEHFSDYLKSLFHMLYIRYKEKKDISPDIFYSLWNKFSSFHLKRGNFWKLMREICLKEGKLVLAWDLTLSKELKDEGGHNRQIVLFSPDPHNMGELKSALLQRKNWKKLLDKSMDDHGKFHPSTHKKLLRLIENHIIPLKERSKPHNLVVKATRFSATPPEWLYFFQGQKRETQDIINQFGEVIISILDNLAEGIWCLVDESDLNLSDTRRQQLLTIGAVFRTMSLRIEAIHPSYDRMTFKYDKLISKYSDTILAELKGNPSIDSYNSAISKAIWNLRYGMVQLFASTMTLMLIFVCIHKQFTYREDG